MKCKYVEKACIGLNPSRGAETARPALCFAERLHLLASKHGNRQDNQLRDAFARLNRIRRAAYVAKANAYFPAVIAVNDADAVRKADTVFDAKARCAQTKTRRSRCAAGTWKALWES